MNLASSILALALTACVARGGPTELGPQAAISLAEEVRKLERTGPIRAARIDHKDLRAHIEGLIPPSERAASDAFGAMLEDLGIDVGSRPLTEQLLDAMGTQVAGFYDPKDKILYGVDRPSAMPLERTTVLVHEGVHALQDQHGYLGDMTVVPGLDDLMAAKQAMIEGDATIAMIVGLARLQGQSHDQVQQALGTAAISIGSAISGLVGAHDLPPVIGEALVFPYAAGFTYLLLGPMKTDGWAALDASLKDPPLSTELVLHPSKHDDPPVLVRFDVSREVPADPGQTWERAPDTVLGERWHRFVFGQHRQSLGAATGWGGDAVQHYRETRSGMTLTIIGTTWDSPQDADEAEAAWRAITPDVVREMNRVVIVAGEGNRTLVPGAVGRAALRTWRQQPVRSWAEARAFVAGP